MKLKANLAAPIRVGAGQLTYLSMLMVLVPLAIVAGIQALRHPARWPWAVGALACLGVLRWWKSTPQLVLTSDSLSWRTWRGWVSVPVADISRIERRSGYETIAERFSPPERLLVRRMGRQSPLIINLAVLDGPGIDLLYDYLVIARAAKPAKAPSPRVEAPEALLPFRFEVISAFAITNLCRVAMGDVTAGRIKVGAKVMLEGRPEAGVWTLMGLEFVDVRISPPAEAHIGLCFADAPPKEEWYALIVPGSILVQAP
jgi:hypothetical protein